MYADITDEYLSYVAGIISGESTVGAYSIGLGVGSRSSVGTSLDSEITATGLARKEGSTSWSSRTLTTVATFTATESDAAIREFGVFQGSTLLYRAVLPVPIPLLKGQSITVTGKTILSVSTADTYSVNEALLYTHILNDYINLVSTISYSLGSTTDLPCTERICFSGKPFRNPSITGITQAKGGKTWEIECVTENYADIDALEIVTAPGQVNTTIEGYQYASSILKMGTLRIWNKASQAYEIHPNCLLIGPISVDILGDNYIYSFKVAESYTGDIS